MQKAEKKKVKDIAAVQNMLDEGFDEEEGKAKAKKAAEQKPAQTEESEKAEDATTAQSEEGKSDSSAPSDS